jgi:hypothetical protein
MEVEHIDHPLSEGDKIDLSALFDDKERKPSSWEVYLHSMLSPYLDEYPFMRKNVGVLRELADCLRTPLDPSFGISSGCFMGPLTIDGSSHPFEIERDRQIREVLERAKSKFSQG